MKYEIGDEVKVIDYRSDHFGGVGTVQSFEEDADCYLVLLPTEDFYFEESQLAPAHTLDALTPGDVVMDNEGLKKTVLERLTQSVLLSLHKDSKKISGWYTIEELKDTGYTLKNTPKCDCKSIEHGSIIRTNKKGNCVECGKNWNTPKETVEEVTVEEYNESTLVVAMGMMAENMQRQALGQSMAYTEADFLAIGGVIKKS